jgi:hypothetical protein
MIKGYVDFVQQYKKEYDCDPDGLAIWNAATICVDEQYTSVPKYLINIINKIDEAIIIAQKNNSENLKGLIMARDIIRTESAQTSTRQTKICHEVCLFKVDNKCNVAGGICLRKEINS